MRSSSVSSLLLIAVLLSSTITGTAYGQSPFPTPTEAQLPLDEGRAELLRRCWDSSDVSPSGAASWMRCAGAAR
jgi:hypothetical protein